MSRSRSCVLMLANHSAFVIEVCRSALSSACCLGKATAPRSTFGEQPAATLNGDVSACLSGGTCLPVSCSKPLGLADLLGGEATACSPEVVRPPTGSVRMIA